MLPVSCSVVFCGVVDGGAKLDWFVSCEAAFVAGRSGMIGSVGCISCIVLVPKLGKAPHRNCTIRLSDMHSLSQNKLFKINFINGMGGALAAHSSTVHVPHTLFILLLMRSSTTEGSARVEVSPRAP